MHIKTAFVVLASLASASAIGCGSSGSANNDGTSAAVRASLHRSKSCGDLLTDLKADAAYKLNRGIDRQIEGIQACMKKYSDDRCAYYGGGYGGGVAFGAGAEATSNASSGPTPAPAAPSAGGTGDAKSTSESATSHSETNTQVKGVDEADIVKNDGKNLYVLHGRAFKVLNAWPADQLKEMASIDVEGTPSEMFVSDGKVVIYSQVNGAAIFDAAGVKPKEQYTEYGYAYAGGAVGVGKSAPAGDMAMPPSPGGQPQIYIPLTKVTVMNLDGTTPSVTREVYFEGSYLDSRRVGPHVRSVFQGNQYGPKLKYSIYELYPQPQVAPGTESMPKDDPTPKTGSQMIAALEQLRAANRASIEASQLGDWLPYTFVKYGDKVGAQTVACEDFYVPTTGSTESGLTEVVSLDLADPAATPKESAILGRADTVYGSADTLYLAARAWVEPPFMWNDQYDVPVSDGTSASPPSTNPGVPATDPKPAPQNLRPQTTPAQPSPTISWASTRTHLHKFEFKSDARFPNYVASGTVNGAVKNQFSLDDKDGFLRVATTENRQYVTVAGKYVNPDVNTVQNANTPPARPNTVNHLYVLGQNGPWLDETGDVGDLAPNEQIYSVRFVEHRGYIVTFRQVDPLFVIDLSVPQKPTLLAALKIPGFSEYMHPLDANHLLTIGRDASTTGRQQGLQLQIFDVTNGANPVVMHKFAYDGSEYGSSDAEYDHKAFTYFAEKNLLAFPYFAYGTGIMGGMRSSLELFKVDLVNGFAKLGSIDHTALLAKTPQGYCGGYYGPSVRRGVFLENFVYSVSYGGVVVKNASDLIAAGKELPLPSPLTNEGYGPVCY